ncbi:Hypothetical predicted protein [Cloeon dipterum]|uniref:Uncharacterized protein n=1 Tax=Cloeon dipterum TaxID=197152 RepID=A0A8S1CYD0_9INSE|nr:Hypothetical predicted protein [Cloeon dipterum]
MPIARRFFLFASLLLLVPAVLLDNKIEARVSNKNFVRFLDSFRPPPRNPCPQGESFERGKCRLIYPPERSFVR